MLSLTLALLPAIVAASYTPHPGEYFTYIEAQDLGNGTGNYDGYTEHTTITGTEIMTGVSGDVVSANYSYSWNWNNSTGSTETGSSSGEFTFYSTTFLYLNGTDDQAGYVNPTVWFVMDNSIPVGGTFTLLNTEMTVMDRNYSYYLPSQDRYVSTIFAQESSSYQRNDEYGQFTATYTWNAYFDPSTGYIVGYSYTEQDSDNSGNGFGYIENLYVNSTSYPLMTAAAPAEENAGLMQYLVYIVAVVIIAIAAIGIYAISTRRKTIPKHPPPPTPPPPLDIDLTPKQPPVQQIVIKEVAKVKCAYCGALIDSTAQVCPVCGGPRS
jgi:hypothetical protein